MAAYEKTADLDPAQILGRRTLIVGDVNSGKTFLTRKVLDLVRAQVQADRIAVLEMAPDIPQETAVRLGLKGVGGKLLAPSDRDVLLLSANLIPPRLTAGSEDEALELAESNREKIDRLFIDFSRSGRDVLFVNDISIYLQAGRTESLIVGLSRAETLVANGYYGDKLGSGALSARERKEMEELTPFFDRVIRL